MKVIKILQDRIQNFRHQQIELLKERDFILENLDRIRKKVEDYQDDINEMQLAIEKLEKPE